MKDNQDSSTKFLWCIIYLNKVSANTIEKDYKENQNFHGICDFLGVHGIDLAEKKRGLAFPKFLNVMLGITQ